jgi:asparagine synthase (glutamine-hydrolysing)
MTGAEETWERLDLAFESALRSVVEPGPPPVVLFSGGVDSGLLAWELRRVRGASLVTVGVAGSDDLEQAARAVGRIGLPWAGRTLEDGDLARVEETARPELVGVPGPRRGIFVALAAAIASAPRGPLLCGQGADELFFGYAHYRGLSAEAAAARSSSDLRALREDDWPRTLRIAALWGKEVHAPYLDPGFVLAACGIPAVERLPGTLTKVLFRRWAVHRGLPESLAQRPKRALQYGSGIDRWLRRRHPRAP